MTNVLNIERRRLCELTVEHIREGYPESVTELNDASRRVVAAMKEEHGKAFLGHINLYEDTRGKPCIWEWDGGLVYNFGASFVAPVHDAELERLILERDAAQYTGTKDDAKRLLAISERLAVIGGVHLIWS